jgi:plastocyanin
LEDSTASQNIVDLKVSERNNNFVWTSVNGQANPTLNLKSGIDYTIQVESMDNNITHQLIIQNESGKQLTKSDEISNGQTDDFTFTFRDIGKYQYHCQ